MAKSKAKAIAAPATAVQTAAEPQPHKYYERVWPEGWKDNEEGGTYIDAAGLNKMEQGIIDNDKAIAALEEKAAQLDEKDTTTLQEAQRYSDQQLTAAKKYSDTNLGTAKSYTDGVATSIRASVTENAEKLSGLDKRLGRLTFSINAEDFGLDITVD